MTLDPIEFMDVLRNGEKQLDEIKNIERSNFMTKEIFDAAIKYARDGKPCKSSRNRWINPRISKRRK